MLDKKYVVARSALVAWPEEQGWLQRLIDNSAPALGIPEGGIPCPELGIVRSGSRERIDGLDVRFVYWDVDAESAIFRVTTGPFHELHDDFGRAHVTASYYFIVRCGMARPSTGKLVRCTGTSTPDLLTEAEMPQYYRDLLAAVG